MGRSRHRRDLLRTESRSGPVLVVVVGVCLAVSACNDGDGRPTVAATATPIESSTTATALPFATTIPPVASIPPVGELQAIVDGWAQRHAVGTVAVSVGSPAGVITSVGYSADGEPPDGSSLFVIASVSKAMMAATTLVLVEEGVLALDEPIVAWLPEFPRSNEITLRQLLADTAGLQDDRPSSGLEALIEFTTTKTRAELLAEAADVVGDEPLPARYHYSNAGFWVVGAVIEAAVGASLADVMEAKVFVPVGMTDTFLTWPESETDRVVEGEVVLPDGQRIPVGTDIIPAVMSNGWGAGGVLASTHDVAAFYSAVFGELLAPASVAAMQTPTPDSGGYALAIDTERFTADAQGWGTAGATMGYTSAAGVTDDGWSVAVLTNHFEAASGGREPSPMGLISELLTLIDAAA